MNKKNILIITFITIFGLGLFVVFFTVFSQQTAPKNDNLVSLNSTPVDNTTPTVATTNEQKSSNVTQSNNTPAQTTTETKTTPINSTTTNSGTVTSTNGTQTTTTTTSSQKNGTYNFEISYRVPQGHIEKVASTITVQNDVITGVKNTYTATVEESTEYQSGFENAISSAIVGKKIDSLDLSRVGGASLTTAAFMKGINSIQ